MNQPTYYQTFLALSNNKLLYIHMAVIAFIVTEVKESGSGVLYALITLTAMACMIYGLFKSTSYDAKITKLQNELKEKGIWRDSVTSSQIKLSKGQFLKRLPIVQPLYAQSVFGVILFSYYLYITEGIPSSFLSQPLGWIQFIGMVLLSILLLIGRASVPFSSPTSFRTRLFTRNSVMNPITMIIYIIGQLPVPTMIVHLLIRMSIEPDMFGHSFFPTNNHVYVMFYFAMMNSYLFERLRYRSILKDKQE